MSAGLSPERLAEIAARRMDEVTAGPWLVADWQNGKPVVYAEVERDGQVAARPLLVAEAATEADVQFVASARRSVPVLLAYIAELQREVVAAKAERDIEIIGWLSARAREYRSTGSQQHALQADAVERAAVAISRGQVRPAETRATEVEAAELTIWRAWYSDDETSLGFYTGRDAAMANVHQVLADEENTTPEVIETRARWVADDPHAPEGEPTAWECWLTDPDGEDETPTGYVVTPVSVAAAYDADGDE